MKANHKMNSFFFILLTTNSPSAFADLENSKSMPLYIYVFILYIIYRIFPWSKVKNNSKLKKPESKSNMYFDKVRYPVTVFSLTFAWLAIFLLEKRISRLYATLEFLLLIVGFSLIDSKRWKNTNYLRKKTDSLKINLNTIEYTGWSLVLAGFVILFVYDISLR